MTSEPPRAVDPYDTATRTEQRALTGLAAANQDRAGVFSSADAERVGLTPQVLRTMLGRGEVRRLRRGWYACGSPASPQQRHLELVHAVIGDHGGRVVASHHSALVVHGVSTHACDLRTVHVTRLDDGRQRAGRGLLVHAADASIRPLRDHRPSWAPALAVAVEFAVAQTALSSGSLSGLVAADHATHIGLTTPEAVLAALATYRHARGMPAARAALATSDPACESAAETVVRRVHHLLGYALESQHPADARARRGERYGRRGDFRLVGTNLLIEADGLAKWASTTPEASERIVQKNQQRDARLADEGWIVLHLYWRDLFTPAGDLDLAGVRAAVLRALRRPGARYDTVWAARLAAHPDAMCDPRRVSPRSPSSAP